MLFLTFTCPDRSLPMKTLYIIRHAKSSWKDPGLTDFERPLNGRGKRNAPEMGRRLQVRGILPELLLASPAKRALATAIAIAEVVGYQPNQIQYNEALYHATVGQLYDVIQAQPNTVQHLAVFGHNPGFTDFANDLANAQIINVPTCGIVAVQVPVASWQQIQPGTGTMLWFDYPKKAFELG